MRQNSNRKLRPRASRGVELSRRLREVKGEATLPLDASYPADLEKLREKQLSLRMRVIPQTWRS